MQKTSVPTESLKTLLEWCEDAIDFKDDSDNSAAKAWETLMETIEKRS